VRFEKWKGQEEEGEGEEKKENPQREQQNF
jgi:hypothetical protein